MLYVTLNVYHQNDINVISQESDWNWFYDN